MPDEGDPLRGDRAGITGRFCDVSFPPVDHSGFDRVIIHVPLKTVAEPVPSKGNPILLYHALKRQRIPTGQQQYCLF